MIFNFPVQNVAIISLVFLGGNFERQTFYSFGTGGGCSVLSLSSGRETDRIYSRRGNFTTQDVLTRRTIPNS